MINARPYSCIFPSDRTALVVIDMQHQFCSPGGMSDLFGADIGMTRAPVGNIRMLLDAFRAAGMPVIHTREGFSPDLSDCPPLQLHRILRDGKPIVGQDSPLGRILIRGEPGHEIIDELAPLPGERVVDKPGIGTFASTDLEAQIREIDVDHFIVTGVTTDCCVQSFVREANDRGFNCMVAEDACAGFDPNLHAAAIDMIVQQGGLIGWAASTASILKGLSNGWG